MNAGLSNPKRSVKICLAAMALGAASMAAGLSMMNGMGKETPLTGALVGVGLLVLIVFTLFLFNFIWAVRLTNAMRRGEGVIARWTVPLQTLEEFREDDSSPKKMRRKNDYRLPRTLPPGGIEVIFSADAVMIGDAFFGLAKSGLARFTDVSTVPGNPLSIAFRMAVTTARGTSYGAPTVRTSRSELRVPVARGASAEASKVLTHYTAVTAGQTIARPGFWALRVKIGLWAAGVAATVAALGFLFNALKIDLGNAPVIMAVAGTVTALGGLVLAGLAALQQRHERGDGRG